MLKHIFLLFVWPWSSLHIYRQSLILLPTTKILLAISVQIWTLLSSQEKRKIIKFKAKLTFLWYDKKPTSLQRNGMAAISKNVLKSFQRKPLINSKQKPSKAGYSQIF